MMQRWMRSLLLTLVALALTGSVALSQSGSAGYYEFSTFVRFQKDVRVYGDAQLDSGLTVRGDLQSKRFRAAQQSTIAITASGTLTPTGTFQPISATSAVGTSSIARGTAGDLLIIMNTVTSTITFTDTGALKLGGNAALGQFDTLTLVSDGTNWVQMMKADN